jgi:hypothetical protein
LSVQGDRARRGGRGPILLLCPLCAPCNLSRRKGSRSLAADASWTVGISASPEVSPCSISIQNELFRRSPLSRWWSRRMLGHRRFFGIRFGGARRCDVFQVRNINSRRGRFLGHRSRRAGSRARYGGCSLDLHFVTHVVAQLRSVPRQLIWSSRAIGQGVPTARAV